MEDVMSAEVRCQEANTLVLTGDVTAENVVTIRKKGEGILRKMPKDGIVELSELKSANTISLSLLLAWLRLANQCNVSLTICGSPVALFDMARVSGLEMILPFGAIEPTP